MKTSGALTNGCAVRVQLLRPWRGWAAWPLCDVRCHGAGVQGEGEYIPSCPVRKFIMGIKMQCLWQSGA